MSLQEAEILAKADNAWGQVFKVLGSLDEHDAPRVLENLTERLIRYLADQEPENEAFFEGLVDLLK